MKSLFPLPLCLLIAGLLAAGCDATGPEQTTDAAQTQTVVPLTVIPSDTPEDLRAGAFTICKIAPDAPEQSFTFTTTAEGTDADDVTPSTTLSDGQCAEVFVEMTGSADAVSVTETVPEGWQLDSIRVYHIIDGTMTNERLTTPTAQGIVQQGQRGHLALYYNSMISGDGSSGDGSGDDGSGDDGSGDDGSGDDGSGDDGSGDDGSGDDGSGDDELIGGEGCTPGAWKNRLLKLNRWPVPATTPLTAVWDVPTALDDATLLDALRFRGGLTFVDKVRILLRAATAGYLNAQTIAYDWPAQQIVDEVNAAIASGDSAIVIDLAATLDTFNNQSCPITERGANR